MIKKDFLKYHYRYYKNIAICQYFSTPQPIHDEGPILRLTDLHIISKSDIVTIEEKSGAGDSTYSYYAQKCSGRVIITLKNSEVIELGIANVK